MKYQFKRKESVSKGVQRLGAMRVAHALRCLKESGEAQLIHCARKDIKKMRALVRLVRQPIPKKDFQQLRTLFRGAAAKLAGPRDTYVKAETLLKLEHSFKRRLPSGPLSKVRAQLQRRYEAEMTRFKKEKTAQTTSGLLRRAGTMFKALELRDGGWSALSAGLETAYREGRRGYRLAIQEPSSENFHEWRKRAKNLGYQVQLLHEMWPEQMEAVSKEIDTLTEYLGDDHDLAVLRKTLLGGVKGDEKHTVLDPLQRLIAERERELRTAALELGARIYEEKPKRYCGRLSTYWRAWRNPDNEWTASTRAKMSLNAGTK